MNAWVERVESDGVVTDAHVLPSTPLHAVAVTGPVPTLLPERPVPPVAVLASLTGVTAVGVFVVGLLVVFGIR